MSTRRKLRSMAKARRKMTFRPCVEALELRLAPDASGLPFSYFGPQPAGNDPTAQMLWLLAHGDQYQPGAPGADADLTARVGAILSSQNQSNGLPSNIASPLTRLGPGPLLDPGAPGTLDVTMQDYDLGNQVFQPGSLGAGQKVELTARVWAPTVLDGQRPLLIFLHGNHSATYNPTTGAAGFAWPPSASGTGFVALPNYQGYDYLGENLASHGYIVASISADGVNVLGGTNMVPRAQLVERSLDLWRDLNATGTITAETDARIGVDSLPTSGLSPFGTRFVGHVDLQDVGLMGHSRGGDGVVAAYQLNQTLSTPAPYGIKAVLPLSPVDFSSRTINNVPLMVMYGYNDGDVSDLQGEGFYDRSRYNVPGDTAPKFIVQVQGANHNSFNTIWWAEPAIRFVPGSGDDGIGAAATRLTPQEQRSTAVAYFGAFFQTFVGNDAQPVHPEYFPFLTGDSPPPASVLPGARPGIFWTYQPTDNAASRRDVNRLLAPASLTTNTLGGAVTQSGLTPYTVAAFTGTPTSAAGTGIPTLQVLRAGWSAPGAFWQNDLPAGSRDVSAYPSLDFRAAVDFGDARNPIGQPQNFQIMLTDGQGNTATTTVNSAYAGRPTPLYFPPLSRHRIMDTVRIPLSLFGGVDLTDVRSVRFDFNQTTSGALWLADLMFANSALAFSVTSSNPAQGQLVTTQPTDFVIHFSAPYDPMSVTAGALTVTPPGMAAIPADSFTLTDPNTITFSFATSPVQTEGGPYTIDIAAGAITSALDGSPVQHFSASFRYSALLLAVDSTSPPVGSQVLLPFTTLDVHFNRPIDPAGVAASNLTVSQGQVTGATALANGQTIEYTLTGITNEGALNVSIAAGVLNDLVGNPNVAFSGSYTLDFGPNYPFPTLKPALPSGSLIYQGTLASQIGPATNDTDSFTLPVDSAHTVTVIVRPDSGLKPSVVLSLSGSQVQSGTAGAAGQPVIFQTVPTPGVLGDGAAPQTYTVAISGADGTMGSYTLQIILNAALDDGSHTTQGSAQDLTPAFVSGRAAAVGSVASGDQHWFSFALTAGQVSTLALNGPGHVALVNSAGTTLAIGRAGPNGSEIINDFIAPAADTYYASVSGTGTGQYTLVATADAGLDNDPNTTFETAQDLVASGTGNQQWVFGNVGHTGISSPHVLYFTDGGPITPDPYLVALSNLQITPTVVAGSTTDPTAPYAAFTSQLQVGGWDLVIFQQRFWASGDFPSFSWTAPFLSYINGGGNVIYSSWLRTQVFADPAVAALYSAFGATTTGVNNQTVVSQVAASPIWNGIPNPLNLTLNSGLVTSSIGLHASATGQAIGRFGNGDDALIIGNNAHTILSGFMPYTANDIPSRVNLTQNELTFLLSRPDPADFYKVTLAPGTHLQTQVLVPGTPAGATADGLQPQVNLYGPTHDLLATGEPGVVLDYTVPSNGGGTYYVQVIPETTPTQGDFVLGFQINTPPTPPVAPVFQVTSSTPTDGSYVQHGVVPTAITIKFNQNILLPTLSASALQLDGVSAASDVVVSGDTVSFTPASAIGAGTHTIHIAAGALSDVAGTGVLDFTASFIVDLTPPSVVGSSIQENDVVTPGAGGSVSYSVTFDRAIKTAGLTSSAFSLVGTTGGTRAPSSFSFDSSGAVLTINYAGLPEDTYRLTLFSSSFVSLAGWALDGETTVGGTSVWPIPPGRSGDGVEGGNFFVDFITNIPTSAYPASFQPALPQGSLIYQGTPVTAFINPAGDTDSYTITLDPGHTLTALVHPNSATLQPAVLITDPAGNPVGSATASAAGVEVVLQAVPITTAGTYTVTVSGAAGTGSFRLQLFLNAALEDSVHGGPPNHTIATAQDLNASFTPLLRTADRGAVLGHANAGGYQASAVAPTFEDISATGQGTLQGTNDSVFDLTPALLGGFQFTFYGQTYNEVFFSTNALITFGSGNSAFSNTDLTASPLQASIAALWTDYVAFDPSSVVYWQVVGTGTDQHLVLEWKNMQFYPGGGPFLTFEAVLNADGSIQFNYADVNNATRGTAGIKDAGAQGPSRLLLAFNNGPNTFVGNNLSTRIAAVAAAPDYYSFTVANDERVTLGLKNLGSGNMTLQLQDASGTTLATGVSADNLDQVINRFALTAGTYYARVTGTSNADYSLVITRDAEFDTEPNGDSAHAQDITGTIGALGHVTGGSSSAGAHVLYFTDGGPITADPYMAALTSLGITPTVVAGSTTDPTAPYAAFTAQLQVGGWDLVIFEQRFWASGDFPSFSWTTPFLNYINGGGHVIYSTWLRSQVYTDPAIAMVYAAFGATSTGNANQTVVSQVGASPIWDGIPNPLNLTLNTGLGVSTIGLHAAAGGQAIGRFANGDDALIVGLTGHTILNGFMPYLAPDPATSAHLAQNEIGSILGGINKEDWYAVSTTAGDTLNFVTTTPGDGPGGFGNTLSPHIRLYDPDGNLVAEGVKLADMRNETLTYTALATGMYRIQVIAENGTRGEYFLDPIETPAISSPTAAAAPIVLPVASRAPAFEVSGALNRITDQPLTVLLTTTPAVGIQTAGLSSESATYSGQLAASVFLSTTAAAPAVSPAGASQSISTTTGVFQSTLMQTDRGTTAPVRLSRQEQPETWNGQAMRETLPLLHVVSLSTDAPLDGPALDGVFADPIWSTDDVPTGALTSIGTSSGESALALLAVLVGSYSAAPTPEPDRRKRKLLPG